MVHRREILYHDGAIPQMPPRRCFAAIVLDNVPQEGRGQNARETVVLPHDVQRPTPIGDLDLGRGNVPGNREGVDLALQGIGMQAFLRMTMIAQPGV